MELRGARDWNDPRLLRKQPRKRELSRRRLLSRGDLPQQIHQCQVRLPRLGREARNHVAKIARIEGGVLVNLPSEETFPQWTERHEADPKFLERRNHRLFRLPPEERVFTLQRGDR